MHDYRRDPVGLAVLLLVAVYAVVGTIVWYLVKAARWLTELLG